MVVDYLVLCFSVLLCEGYDVDCGACHAGSREVLS